MEAYFLAIQQKLKYKSVIIKGWEKLLIVLMSRLMKRENCQKINDDDNYPTYEENIIVWDKEEKIEKE